jgi:hypothetical protein
LRFAYAVPGPLRLCFEGRELVRQQLPGPIAQVQTVVFCDALRRYGIDRREQTQLVILEVDCHLRYSSLTYIHNTITIYRNVNVTLVINRNYYQWGFTYLTPVPLIHLALPSLWISFWVWLVSVWIPAGI